MSRSAAPTTICGRSSTRTATAGRARPPTWVALSPLDPTSPHGNLAGWTSSCRPPTAPSVTAGTTTAAGTVASTDRSRTSAGPPSTAPDPPPSPGAPAASTCSSAPPATAYSTSTTNRRTTAARRTATAVRLVPLTRYPPLRRDFQTRSEADRARYLAEARVAEGRANDPRRGRQTFERYVEDEWLPNHVMEVTTRLSTTKWSLSNSASYPLCWGRDYPPHVTTWA